MSGKTLSGENFERQSGPFESKYGVLRAVTVSNTLEPDSTLPFSIAIHYTGSGSKTFSLSATASKEGLSGLSPSPSSVTISGGSSIEVVFRLLAQSSLDGQMVTVTFRATNEDLSLIVPIDFTVESAW